jgi:beta-glucanase (GH16 family)
MTSTRWIKNRLLSMLLVAAAGCGEAAVGESQQALVAGTYNLGTLARPGACMDVAGAGTADGTNIQEWTCNGSGAQAFRLDDLGGGWSRIVNASSNKCVDVAWNGTADGTNIQLAACNGSGAQAWRFDDVGNGHVQIVGQTSNKCIDVVAAGTADGTRLQLYSCNGTNAQIWNPALLWHLVWSDEFDWGYGAPIDSSKWTAETGGNGWGNQELEYYTNSTQNAQQQNGSLVMTATRENAYQYGCWYGTCQYTSARLVTKGKFQFTYGRAEARIKIPRGRGLWSAFWALGGNIDSPGVGWPNCGEIDIMENVGQEPQRNHGSLHGPGYSGANPLTAWNDVAGALADDFHVYAVEWEPAAIRFYVDNTLYETRTPADVPGGGWWVYDHGFFLLLNVAVGGNWPGSPDWSTSFPQQMLVDYVRVYQR